MKEEGCGGEGQCAYPPIEGQQDGVTLDVPVDDTLAMQVSQGLQHSLTHSSDLLLVQPGQGRQGHPAETVSFTRAAGLGKVEGHRAPPHPNSVFNSAVRLKS